MNVQLGADTYGRVKVVGALPIVTKFFAVNGVPIYPQQSLYFLGQDTKAQIPFVLSETMFHGVPLARVDRSSVVVAYARAVFAVCLVVGVCGLFMLGLTVLNSQVIPDAAEWGAYVLGSLAALGIGGGLSTYLFPFVAARERTIRELCGEYLGLCIDPAVIAPDFAAKIDQEMADVIDGGRRLELLQRLVRERCRIALANNSAEAEQVTDELMKELSRTPGIPKLSDRSSP